MSFTEIDEVKAVILKLREFVEAPKAWVIRAVHTQAEKFVNVALFENRDEAIAYENAARLPNSGYHPGSVLANYYTPVLVLPMVPWEDYTGLERNPSTAFLKPTIEPIVEVPVAASPTVEPSPVIDTSAVVLSTTI